MTTPRDCTGSKLVRALSKFDYTVLRQTGSHIRLVTHQSGVHHITVPNHDPIKVGTLHAVLKDVAAHHKLSVAQLLHELDL